MLCQISLFTSKMSRLVVRLHNVCVRLCGMVCVSAFARARDESCDMCAWEGMLFGVCARLHVGIARITISHLSRFHSAHHGQ